MKKAKIPTERNGTIHKPHKNYMLTNLNTRRSEKAEVVGRLLPYSFGRGRGGLLLIVRVS